MSLAEWSIRHWPPIGHDVFLSHAAEDRSDLVLPTYDALRECGIVPWVDRHDYPVGRSAFETLRDRILRSRHVVYFVTPAVLRQGRGWCAAERTLADQAQRLLSFRGTDFVHFEFPLLFVTRDDPRLLRSVWAPVADRAVCYRSDRRPRESRIEWAARWIGEFIEQEREWDEESRTRLVRDDAARSHFAADPSLLKWIRRIGFPPIEVRPS